MRLGLIVNPIAGVGGPLAMKGSDNTLAMRALAAGARPLAADRAVVALSRLADCADCVVVTSAGSMGEEAALRAGLTVEVAYCPPVQTSAIDTIAAAQAIRRAGVDLIAFAGGDGTARDIVAADLGDVLVIGIPAGVKMHSAVFATGPAAAGAILHDWRNGRARPALAADVLDRDAEGHIRIYGVLAIPRSVRMQASKAVATSDAQGDLERVAVTLADELKHEPLAIVGPGASMMMVKRRLGGGGTLLGADAYACGVPVAIDADASTLRRLVMATPPKLILGVIGGQGFLLGRGNQQIDAEVVRRAGKAGMVVLADAGKLAVLRDGTLLVDSGDPALDHSLEGFVAVRTAVGRTTMMRIRAA